MAHLLFGADLSLGLSARKGHDDPDAKSGVPITGNVAVEDTGKKNHTGGLVDYLGALPVLKTGFGAPIPPALSYVSCDSANIPESLSTQLTLFYAGTVNAFDNVIEDKAQIVMSLAGNSNTLHASTSSFKMPVAPSSPQLQDPMKKMQPENLTTAAHLSIGERLQVSDDGHAQEFASLLVPCQAIVPKALPLARKASLARFLEKRKERVRLMAPYLAKGSARDITHQGAHHSNASTLHMFYNDFWGDRSRKTLGCASRFVYGNNVDVEDHNWFTIAENSKQASECGSAT